MAYRIAREDWQALDPAAMSSTAGGVPVYNDGTTTPPWEGRPGQSKEQFIVSEALRLMVVPADQIRMIRPVTEHPEMPQMGYVRAALTITEVLDTDRWAPQRRSWISGVPTKPRKSDMQQEMFAGSARPAMSQSPML